MEQGRSSRRLKDPFTLRRLLCFLCIHLVAFGAEISAMALFGFTGDLKFVIALLVPFLFSGMFCTHAAWYVDLPHCKSRLMPLKDKPLCVALLLAIPMGIFQGVIVMLALEEYGAKSGVADSSDPRERRRSASSLPPNKYHCKAVNGLFEGIASTAVLLYAFWSMGIGDPPITTMRFQLERPFVGLLGIVCFLSAGLGLMELDYCTSRTISRRMRSPRYEVFHWLFRTCEVTSRVCMFICFMVTTRQQPQWQMWWCLLLMDFCFTVLVVTVFGGVESAWWIRILCSFPCLVCNIFAFIDSPYKRRAAKHVSLWLTAKHAAELILLPALLYWSLQEELYVDLQNNWRNHRLMVLVALSCSVLYWLLLWYLSSKSMHRNNMIDIFSASETGRVSDVRSAMRELTHSAAVCLNVNSPDVDGNTPLMLAAARGHAEVCGLLIKEGARVDLRRFRDNRKCRTCLVISLRRQWTALHIAASKGHLKTVQVLLEGAGLLNTPAAPAADSDLLFNYQDVYGETPLHVAARAGWVEICCYLAHHVPCWKEVLAGSYRPVDLARQEVQQAIADPSPMMLQDLVRRSTELSRVPLLPTQTPPGEESWPQVQLAIARSSRNEQLMAPGLCSYVASSCGGALGRVFLILAEPEEFNPGVSILSGIPEENELGNSSISLQIAGAHPSPDDPVMADLRPANRQNEVVEWWANMAQQAAQQHASGAIFATIPPDAVLGEGSYGLVWRAKDRHSGKLFAVKNIRQRQNTSEVSRREYEVSDRIRLKPHPCLVQLFLVHNFRDAGLYVLVMEFCSGGDVLQRIKAQRDRLTPRQYKAPSTAVPWIAQVFLGLEHMHLRMQTLLRDLKPENVVLSENCAKLTDFGFGRFGVESTGIWSFGMPTGSPGYVAPEVLAQQNYDSRADLYSLGVLVWVLLTGGLLNKADPLPPMGKMKFAGDFAAHQRDCEMLKRCLEQPESNLARRLKPTEQDFVARLIPRRPADRMCHKEIREHPLLQKQLPAFSATWAEVNAWAKTQAEASQR